MCRAVEASLGSWLKVSVLCCTSMQPTEAAVVWDSFNCLFTLIKIKSRSTLCFSVVKWPFYETRCISMCSRCSLCHQPTVEVPSLTPCGRCPHSCRLKTGFMFCPCFLGLLCYFWWVLTVSSGNSYLLPVCWSEHPTREIWPARTDTYVMSGCQSNFRFVFFSHGFV